MRSGLSCNVSLVSVFLELLHSDLEALPQKAPEFLGKIIPIGPITRVHVHRARLLAET